MVDDEQSKDRTKAVYYEVAGGDVIHRTMDPYTSMCDCCSVRGTS